MPFDGAGFGYNESLQKLDTVIDLLETPDRWCKGALRSHDGRYCIRGAIRAVSGSGCASRPCLCARGATTRSAGRAISRPARIRPARISGASSRRRAARLRARPLPRFFEQADDLRVFGLPEIAVMRAHRIEGVGG